MSWRKTRHIDVLDRLQQPLNSYDNIAIEDGFVEYLAASKEDMDNIKIDVKYLAKVLPYVQY